MTTGCSLSAYGLTRGAWVAVAVFAGASAIAGVFLSSVGLIVLGALVLGLATWLAIDTPAGTRTRRMPRFGRAPVAAPEPATAAPVTAPRLHPSEPPVTIEHRDPVPTRSDPGADPPQSPPVAASNAPSIAVSDTLDAREVLDALLASIDGLADAVSAHLWLADESSATLRLIAATGPMAPSPQPLALDGEDVLGRSFRSGQAETGALARISSGGTDSTLWRHAFPLRAGEASGAAAIDLRGASEPDVVALAASADPLRGALAGALALHVARTELETANGLIESARELSRLLDPAEVLARSLTKAMEISDAATGSIMLLDPATGRLVIALSRGLPAEVVRDTSLAEGEGIAGWVLASGQPLLIEDLPARTPAARRHGIRSAVSVPIGDDDGVLGVLNVGSRSFPARFTQSHLAAIEILGKQTATALRNAQAVSGSRELYFDTLKALALALETKDPYSRGGTERIVECATTLSRAFGMSADERDALRVAALLHDIGMAAAGEGVLTADRPLSTVEQALLKMHPQIAADMLAEAPALRYVVPIVYHHHEWYDGQGYLGGLIGERIPLGARILAVADAYVAMTSDRPYRGAYSQRDALKELAEKAGTQFDPAVVDALRDILEGGANRVPGSSGDWA
jgi:hypothetical protein